MSALPQALSRFLPMDAMAALGTTSTHMRDLGRSANASRAAFADSLMDELNEIEAQINASPIGNIVFSDGARIEIDQPLHYGLRVSLPRDSDTLSISINYDVCFLTSHGSGHFEFVALSDKPVEKKVLLTTIALYNSVVTILERLQPAIAHFRGDELMYDISTDFRHPNEVRQHFVRYTRADLLKQTIQLIYANNGKTERRQEKLIDDYLGFRNQRKLSGGNGAAYVCYNGKRHRVQIDKKNRQKYVTKAGVRINLCTIRGKYVACD